MEIIYGVLELERRVPRWLNRMIDSLASCGRVPHYAYSYKRICIINHDCLYINIYMTFRLIIYISTNQNFVNVTMYCCRHVICNFSYYMYSRMCNQTEQVSHTTQIYEASAGLTAEARVVHKCVLYHITQALPTLLVILNVTMHCTHFCQCIRYAVHSIMTII